MSSHGAAGRARRVLILSFLLFILLGLLSQGCRGLWRPDEGRYTNVALQMLRSGDWIHPKLHHEIPHYSKPPLTYWAIAASISLFGENEWAARLPNALAYLLTALAVFGIAGALAPGRAPVAGMAFCTMGLPFLAAGVITTDTLLTAFETLAMLGYVKHRFAPHGARPRLPLVCMWAMFGLAFLTKGPPGLLPLLAILVFTVWSEGGRALGGLCSVLGLAAFAVIGGTWFGVLFWSQPELAGELVRSEVIDRIFSGHHHRNAQWYGAFLIYVPSLLAGTLPWTWTLLRTIARGREPLRDPAHPERKLLAAWILVPLLVFFIARSRLAFYVLPLFVPLSVMVALSWRGELFAFGRRQVWLLAWMALLVGGKFASAFLPQYRDARHLAHRIESQLTENHVDFNVQEVVFIRTQAYYGLSMYLHCEVEQVLLSASEATKAKPFQSLQEELAEPEEGRLFVIPHSIADRFLDEAHLAGKEMVAVGKAGKLRFYAIRARH